MAGLLTFSRNLNAFPASPNPSKGGKQEPVAKDMFKTLVGNYSSGTVADFHGIPF